MSLDDQLSVDGVVWPGCCRPRLLGTAFVSTPNRGGISDLQSVLYNTAIDMTSPHNVPSDLPRNITLPLHCILAERSIKAWLGTAEGFLAPMLVSSADLWERLCKQKLLSLSKTEFINALTLLGTVRGLLQ